MFLQIIYEINQMFMEEWKKKIGNDYARLSRMSIVEEGSVKVVRPKMPRFYLFGNLWNTWFEWGLFDEVFLVFL